MDPLSLTLAVIPLLVSVAENYRNVHSMFHRMRKASREAANLRVDFIVQQSLFYDSCRCLFGQCGIDEPTVLAMLKDSQHEAWLPDEFCLKMKETLGRFDQALVGILERIECELKMIGNEVDKCYKSDRNTGWRVRLAAKKVSLDRSIELVNRLNTNLNDIRMRIVDTNRTKQSISLPVHSEQQARNKFRDLYIQDFTFARTVSHHLHRTVAGACTEHSRHITLLSPTPETNAPSKSVRFELALQDTQSHSWTVDRTTWLTFEFLMMDRQTLAPPAVRELVFVPKTETALPMAPSIATETQRGTDVTSSEGPRYDGHRAFRCDPETLSSSCRLFHLAGHFENAERTRLRVYRKSNLEFSTSGTSSTLNDFLLQSACSDGRFFNQYECIRLGRELAAAVLNFHSTPWLSSSWNGQQVQLICIESPILRIKRYEPYLKVEVSSSRAELAPSLSQANHPVAIENPFLFRLGVLLLELAFERPLREMRIAEDERDGPAVAEFNTAMRVKNNVSTIFGMPYARIVGQCLKCNFQSGLSDLQESALQGDVYRDVFSRLSSLELKLKSVWC